ncbi:hypothetical protein [Streptomyces poriferorum]|uniref:Integral membrane protein n=1 Tax=Streptomyces poriferorum TaxID=2798799 RepID=A0ABY9J4D3_9ACTN|nr:MULTISPECIES: hypothetical protein [unclassified Streptomyces]MDP5317360.1 hypothetical protein [Streptomyces sp. Alt4]WLQ62050.1 hypothetical protein P8A19_42000 [Streptomyces sp. Alt2]
MSESGSEADGEFIENEPANSYGIEFASVGEPGISEDLAPEHSETARLLAPHNIHETRHRLAMGMLGLVALLAVLPVLALIAGRWTKFDDESFRELSLVFTPVVALASAAFGFFFASDDRNRP